MLCISDFDMFGSPSLQPWMLWAFQLSPGTASFRSSKRYPSAIQALDSIASGKARFCMPNVLSTNLNNEEVDKTWQNVKYTGCISGWQVRCLPFGASVRCRLRKARQPAQVTSYDFVPHSAFWFRWQCAFWHTQECEPACKNTEILRSCSKNPG